MSEHDRGLDRRNDDPRLTELCDRMTALENEIKHLAPKVLVIEKIADLQRGQDRLSDNFSGLNRTVDTLAQTMQSQYGQLTSEIKKAFDRMGEINEETMKKLAIQADETHKTDIEKARAETAKARAEIEQMKTDAENKKLSKQIIVYGGAASGIMGIIAFLAFMVWMLQQVAVPGVKP